MTEPLAFAHRPADMDGIARAPLPCVGIIGYPAPRRASPRRCGTRGGRFGGAAVPVEDGPPTS
ncbi:hypothetical protein ACFYW8_05075 [Streptomyces sp. NPDC002742]|uniref:hypothetical protein n=1 Tax=Streptomyces sp. NPDC002742 TaxID=3364663 RepID=UPI0036A0F626